MKKPQFGHQAEDFVKSRDLLGWAWLWEMGLGKSKQMIDTAVHLWREGRIEALLVVAPNGVHANFLSQEIPAHLDDDVMYVGHTYYSSRAGTRSHQQGVAKVTGDTPSQRFRILVISYDACGTDGGFSVAEKFLKNFKTMMVLDESSMIKEPRSKRSKRVMALGKLATYRRIADGTPVAEGPFDIYNQLMFLYPEYWKRHGLSSFFVFKTMFGLFVKRKAAQGHQYMQQYGYQNLEYLQKLIGDVSTRYLKEDCLDLPPKMYKTLTFQLTGEQRALYEQLRDDLRADIEGGEITAPSAMVRLIRLQQIASGYAVGERRTGPELDATDAPASAEEAQQRLEIAAEQRVERYAVEIVPPKDNPRLQLLLSYLETCHHKAIIWCRFTKDIEIICDALGENALRYDGTTPDSERQVVLTRFRDPAGPQFLVVNLAALSRGVTLVIAKTVIYYSNGFALSLRLQSEDRAHRIGQDEKVQYVDLVAEDTVDEHIVKTLREKFDLAATVTGDRIRDWINI